MSSFVSIIIPCKNEEKFIGNCLDSILDQNYSKNEIEILIIDGMSEDKTRKIVRSYCKKYPFIKLLDNFKKFTPFALNIGIKEARGDIIIRVDAHARYGKEYVSKSVNYLKEYGADNVGGILKTIPAKNTLIAKAITIALSHPFGTGSYFRKGSDKLRFVDTVFGGCYKRDVFDRIGLFNEKLLRSQDMEFNLRLKKAGGKILLAPDIVSYYYPKTSLKSFLKHNFTDGIWATYPLKLAKVSLGKRHYLPLSFVLGFIGTGILGVFIPFFLWLFLLGIGTYLLLNIYFSAKIAIKEKDFRYLFVMPLIFAARHFGYGFGSLWGLIKAT